MFGWACAGCHPGEKEVREGGVWKSISIHPRKEAAFLQEKEKLKKVPIST